MPNSSPKLQLPVPASPVQSQILAYTEASSTAAASHVAKPSMAPSTSRSEQAEGGLASVPGDSESVSASPRPATPVESESERLRLRSIRRANARLITSNVMPAMDNPEERPYCIWYPGLATEDTYRELARRYPAMRYQVGRACAVGGYLSLFLELNLLPEVSIAEEAREVAAGAGLQGSTAIFEHIMRQPVRYAVMDDYKRTVDLDNPRAGAHLNGDTAVRPPLQEGPTELEDGDNHWVWPEYFDITEEWNMTEKRWRAANERPWNLAGLLSTKLSRNFTYLLYSPLPLDLPTTRKDTLIIMAAYEGNVDRYHRLKRPDMVPYEDDAVIRGIYHNTGFAKYWETHEDAHDPRFDDWRDDAAVMARFIMVNEISCITEDPDDTGDQLHFPHMIWYPLLPREETLREIVRRRPNNIFLKRSVAIACIAANYQATYVRQILLVLAPFFLFSLFPGAIGNTHNKNNTANIVGQCALNIPPSKALWQQALKSRNPYYAEDIKEKAARGPDAWPGVDPFELELPPFYVEWEEQQALDMAPTTTLFAPTECWNIQVKDRTYGDPYEGWEVGANAAPWELYMAASEELRDKVDQEPTGCLRLYSDNVFNFEGWRDNLPWNKKEGSVEDKGDQDEA